MIETIVTAEETGATVRLAFETSDNDTCLNCDRYNMVTTMVMQSHVRIASQDGHNVEISGVCHGGSRKDSLCGFGSLSIQRAF